MSFAPAFWKSWSKSYRYIWYTALATSVLSLLFLWIGYFHSPDGVLDWQKLQEQKIVETTVHSFRLGPFQLNVPAESYVILEYFNGSNVVPNEPAAYIFLVILAVAAVLILSVMTTLDTFWYFIATGIFILFMVGLRLEVLGLFQSGGRAVPIGIIAAYVIASYYFARLRTATPFSTRLIVFGAMTALVGFAIAFASKVEYPFFHVYLTSFTPSIVIVILFAIMVAHEIVAAFLAMAASASARLMRHFVIITAIWFINVFITAMHRMNVIDWNFIYIDSFLLLTVSAIAGLWGFRQREPLYSGIIAFHPFGALFYAGFAAISFGTIAHLFHNGNDAGIKVIADSIIFSQAGYGLIFVLYIVSNFGGLMFEDKSPVKVLYAPRRMPYFTYRFAGMIAALAFVLYGNWRFYVYHGMGAFYTIAGDMHTLLGNDEHALTFYNQASDQAFQSHRPNYSLATRKTQSLDIIEAHQYYAWANARRPTEYSLVNAGNVFLWENNGRGAVNAYKKGLKVLPGSARLANNAGVAFARVNNIDSAVMLLNAARERKAVRSTAETNFFALAAMGRIPLNVDSVLRLFDTRAAGTVANALALATIYPGPMNADVDPLETETLNLHQATLLNNYIIRNAKEIDSSFSARAFQIASRPENGNYSEALKASLAFAYYHQGNVTRALEILAEQVYLSQSYQGKFNYIMGLWALEQGNPEIAASYFAYADTYDYKEARFYHAIAMTERGRPDEAMAAWDSVYAGGTAEQKYIADRIRTILTIAPREALKLSDHDKYQFCRYRISLGDSLLFNRLSYSFEDANYEAQALLDQSRRYFHAGHLIPAIHYYRRIAGLKLTDRALYDEARYFELRLLASRRELRPLATQINKGLTFEGRDLEKAYYAALIQEASGDTANAARNYRILATYNPYFEDGVIAAYEFFRNRENPGLLPYNILAEAIHVNTNSLRLLRAFRDEALRSGLEEYAANAAARIEELEQKHAAVTPPQQ